MTYTAFKTLVNAKGLEWQYEDATDQYNIYAFDGPDRMQTVLFKATSNADGIPASNATDRTDFENNYKTGANTRLSPKFVHGRQISLCPVYTVHLRIPTITATTQAIIIDLDNSSYPHDTAKDHYNLNKVTMYAQKSVLTDVWQINFGIVKECDGTDGTVVWFHHIFDYDGNRELKIGKEYEGSLDTDIVSGELLNFLSKHEDKDNTVWKNTGDTLKSAATAPMSGTPKVSAGVGDLVVEWELISGTGNLNKNTIVVTYHQ